MTHRFDPWATYSPPATDRSAYWREYYARNREKRIEAAKRRQKERRYPVKDRREYWRKPICGEEGGLIHRNRTPVRRRTNTTGLTTYRRKHEAKHERKITALCDLSDSVMCEFSRTLKRVELLRRSGAKASFDDRKMEDPVDKFIEKIDRLEKLYGSDKYYDCWLIHRSLLIAVRDELRSPSLFGRVPEDDRSGSPDKR